MFKYILNNESANNPWFPKANKYNKNYKLRSGGGEPNSDGSLKKALKQNVTQVRADDRRLRNVNRNNKFFKRYKAHMNTTHLVNQPQECMSETKKCFS